MVNNEFHVFRQVDVNHTSGLVEEIMYVKQGVLLTLSPEAYLVLDKFRYLRGLLDNDIASFRESLDHRTITKHPFIPRPAVWHIELMRIIRKGWRGNDEFKVDKLNRWEKELLALGESFDKDAIDAGNGVWQKMYRIQMTLKRGISLNPTDSLYHESVIQQIPISIQECYGLVDQQDLPKLNS